MGFLKGCYGSSMVFLWDFHWIPMGSLWYFYWIPMGFLLDSCGFPRYFHGVSIIFLEDSYGNSHGISLWFLCYSMLFLSSFYGISVGFLWDFHDISMIFSMRLLWDVN